MAPMVQSREMGTLLIFYFTTSPITTIFPIRKLSGDYYKCGNRIENHCSCDIICKKFLALSTFLLPTTVNNLQSDHSVFRIGTVVLDHPPRFTFTGGNLVRVCIITVNFEVNI